MTGGKSSCEARDIELLHISVRDNYLDCAGQQVDQFCADVCKELLQQVNISTNRNVVCGM